MKYYPNRSRIVGVLLLLVFIIGIIIFQFLQGPILFSDDYLSLTSQNSEKIVSSVLLGILSGILTIIVSVLLLPIFKKHHPTLAYVYIAFCILNFLAIMIDNYSVLSMLELSKSNWDVTNLNNQSITSFFAQMHWWTHYLYLILSCFPVYVLYLTLYRTQLVPRIISLFGIGAVFLMFIEVIFSMYGNGISGNMLLPMGLIQLTLPIYLILKGFKIKT